ncbi:hypothetical protein DL96DRAFT_1666490 [Flagelloscypha sp. PMI_526]|nr:hypothetical protein DL96DRAFT_1666490 [Flagelloscypha sp. PMI_526]
MSDMSFPLPTYLFGSNPTSESIRTYISTITSLLPTSHSATVPEVKAYSDTVYVNYYDLGLSLLYVPIKAYKPKTGSNLEELDLNRLILDGIDFYNVPPPKEKSDSTGSGSAARKAELAFASHPSNPLVLPLKPTFEISPETTGQMFPARKGGGSGPSSGSINIWCEWSDDGIMAWERGKGAIWKVLSVFVPKVS